MDKKIKGQQLSNIEVCSFCGEMAMMLKAGISLSESLELMLSDKEENKTNQILTGLKDRFEETSSFSQACCESGMFPDYLASMIKIGEETGNLDDVFASMEKYYSRESDIQNSIHNAVTFPLVIIVLMAAVIVVLLTEVFPVFNQVFEQLGSNMSGLSAVLLNLGSLISRYAKVFVIILVFIAAFAIYGIHSANGRKMAKKILSAIPSIKRILDSLSIYRFANGMSLTLGSGLLIEKSLEITEELIDDTEFRNKIKIAEKEVREGGSLDESLKKTGLFPDKYIKMLMVGYHVGNTDEAMGKIANLSEEDFETKIFNIIATIEPAMVVILSIIVGVILLSVMLPLTGIMAGI